VSKFHCRFGCIKPTLYKKNLIAELLGKICLLLSDKKEIRFPVELNKRLKNAKPDQLNNIELICNGTGLHWPDLDEDLSVVGILEGKYGAE